MKKFLAVLTVLVATLAFGFYHWAGQPIMKKDGEAIGFTIEAGSGVRGATEQVAAAGVPVQPLLLEALVRLSGKSSRIKAGAYELEPGTTPRRLVEQLVRGEFAQHALVVIEGWTFRQMRQAVAENAALKHDTVSLSDEELLAKVTPDYKHPEGLFFPDTYLFAKGASDLQIYRRAHALMQKKLEESWAARTPGLPYKTPYEALIMASIVEKETGQRSERDLIAGVFVNRLRQGMMLQTDPRSSTAWASVSAATSASAICRPIRPTTPIPAPACLRRRSRFRALQPLQPPSIRHGRMRCTLSPGVTAQAIFQAA